jgi:hypothetical protein
MNDLILITYYNNNDIRKEILLRNLVISLKNKYDIMLVSHSVIPTDIVQNVNYHIYDKENEILTDRKYFQKPWFAPNNDRIIYSSYVMKAGNTHITIWRMIGMANLLASSLNYNKVHYIEYDTEINNFDEIEDNSKLLDNNNSVVYLQDNIPLGCFFSYRLDNLHSDLIGINTDKLKKEIIESNHKCAEIFLREKLDYVGKVYSKHPDTILKSENKHNLSDNGTKHYSWFVPFYDRKLNTLNVMLYNNNYKDVIEAQIIYDNKVYNRTLKRSSWSIIDLGKPIYPKKLIMILDNNKVENYIITEDIEKDSYRVQ